ncbi:MAG TPA: hypothetical protein VHI72_17900 [Hyphomicrobiaceae bacterium]|nr:hypothetical protein [Hyphomicrobiaceae bacterium]
MERPGFRPDPTLYGKGGGDAAKPFWQRRARNQSFGDLLRIQVAYGLGEPHSEGFCEWTDHADDDIRTGIWQCYTLVLLATTVDAQTDRYDLLANNPMAENRPTSGTTKLLKGKLLSLANGPDVPTDQHAWDQGWHRRALQWSNPGRQPPLLPCLCGDVPRPFDPSIRYDASNPRGGLNLMLT